MKAIRIAQVVALVLVAIYGWVFHNVNPDYVILPLLISMSPALLVLIAVLLTWLLTSLPARARTWRLERRLKQTREERDALEAQLRPPLPYDPAAGPVIPDRIDPYEASSAERRGDDPTDYL
ncbi:hypothetical protein BH23DEI1_BH23DEI1_15020 [soil metagenome]|nr:hypothetical protein [Trueperaceae bacterium]